MNEESIITLKKNERITNRSLSAHKGKNNFVLRHVLALPRQAPPPKSIQARKTIIHLIEESCTFIIPLDGGRVNRIGQRKKATKSNLIISSFGSGMRIVRRTRKGGVFFPSLRLFSSFAPPSFILKCYRRFIIFFLLVIYSCF